MIAVFLIGMLAGIFLMLIIDCMRTPPSLVDPQWWKRYRAFTDAVWEAAMQGKPQSMWPTPEEFDL